MTRLLSLLPIALCAITSTASFIAADHDPVVRLDSGVVVGTATRVLNEPTNTGVVHAYLGVPFAAPPERFAPPKPAQARKEPLIAQTLPPACLQQFGTGVTAAKSMAYFNNPGGPPPAESEDCLYLNVFAPKEASPKNLKPVMFWLYGGNLQFGTASLAYYNGSSLAVNQDVVVVAINYRTNIFGFSNSPELPEGESNAGFLDQRWALQWVQDNIRHFGGDPSKVTIFGESAGGYSIKQLLAMPPSPLPYRGAIMESQQASTTGNGTANYEMVSAHFNCTTAPSEIECLRKVSGKDIQAYINQADLSFPPVADNTTYMTNVLPSIVSGKFADVPIFMGTNKDEARIFLAIGGLFPAPPNVDFVESIDLLTGINISQYRNLVLGAYPAAITGDTDQLTNRVLTDLVFTCTTQLLSDAIALAGRQPVWRYCYEGVFPDVSYFPNAGAYHSAEIPEVWGTYMLSNAYGKATPNQIALSKYMEGVWAGFAKNPAGGVPWPKLETNAGFDIGILGGKKKPTGERTANRLETDFACPVFDPLLIAAGMAY